MSFLGLMTVKAHEAAMAACDAHWRKSITEQVDTIKAISMSAERRLMNEHDLTITRLEAEAQRERETAARILQRNIALQARLDAALDEIEALTPDAMKHRERLRRDRENAAAKRAKAVGRLIPRVKVDRHV